MSDWEEEDGFAVVAKKIPTSWDDEVDDVPDAWDAEEVKQVKPKSAPAPVEKLPLAERIKLKEEQKRKEKEEKLKREEEARAEQSLSELQRERLAEEAELGLLQDTFGPTPASQSQPAKGSIDLCDPKSKDDFNKLNDQLKEKITQFEKSPHYSAFAERLIRDIITETDVDTLRSLNTAISALLSEKQKILKGKVKKKAKTKLMVERDNAFNNFDEEDAGAIEPDEFDDFM